MPAILSKLMSMRKQSIPALIGFGAVFAIISLYKRAHGLRVSKSKQMQLMKASDKKKESKAHINQEFFSKLLRIRKILIPSLFSGEVFYMLVIAFSLLARTYADVWMITTSTKIEASIIDRNKPEFGKSVFHYLMCMPLVSVVNNLLKFGLSELKLRFRERFSTHLYNKYLQGFTYYKMSNLDNRIANADQLLTQDVDRFCEGLVDLYSNLSKPIVDVALYVTKLGGALGFQAPSVLFIYLFISGVFLTNLRKPMGPLTVTEQQLEGDFRYVNTRLITNSEEIAFYKGNQKEKTCLMNSFHKMVSHLRSLIIFKFSIGFLDNIIAKYAATTVGWFTVSRPFFDGENSEMMAKDKNELIQDYYNSGRMMFKLAEALGRLALAGRELTRLAGFTTRVDTLLTVLNDLQGGKYERTMVSSNQENSDMVMPLSRAGTGQLVFQDNIIKFEEVPLVTPNGDVLIKSLNMTVTSGINVLIAGPNGCGKSSLFRTLGELWPLFGGKLTKPEAGKLFYVPQRPYMTLGTLRDQIIYPDTQKQMREKKITDHDLLTYLQYVKLDYILQRESGWEAVQDWMDVLSGGEKQRIAMARLFYHKPQFAILDECTSAVSVDVEGEMYNMCREMNITLFTVSHRKSLWQYHDYSLQMDGRGNYEYKKIEENSEQFGS
uniref:ATP-binding cassette sub-family D member 3 n=1 Tax=Rhabditophanes sp. KR3021 TaxID=114890 RepID=A0AC35U7T3_9BILA